MTRASPALSLRPRLDRVVAGIPRSLALLLVSSWALAASAQDAQKTDAAPPAADATASDAQGAEAAAQPDAQGPSVPFEKYTLGNGLEVILHQDPRLPVVAVDVWYHVGGLHETKGKTGFAHLFEHLMFQGTPHVGEDKHFAYLEEAGASLVNGTTDFDRTNYFEVVPKNELELALWLESDRMGWLMAGMTQAKLDEQRNVVKNERRQSLENTPYGLTSEKLWKAMFPADHPYWGSVIGSMQDLDAASLEDVARFYDLYYAPSNATLVLAGDFDPATAKALVEKYFATLPGAPKPPVPSVQPPSIAKPIRLDEPEPVATLPKITVSWFTPPFFAEGDAELDVLGHVLSAGNASRLQQALMQQTQVAESVDARQQSMGNVSVFSIDVVVREGVDPNEVVEAVLSQVALLRDLPPSADEIRRAVNTIERDKLFDLQTAIGKAELLQTYNHYKGTPEYLAEDLARYRDVTPESVLKVVNDHLTQEKRAVLVAVPPAPGAEQPAAEQPAAGGASSAAPDAPSTSTTPTTTTKEDQP